MWGVIFDKFCSNWFKLVCAQPPRFFETKFRGGQNFYLTVRSFFNEREYSGNDWLVPLVWVCALYNVHCKTSAVDCNKAGSKLFNTPGVAGAVLQTPLSVIESPFSSKSFVYTTRLLRLNRCHLCH